MVVAVTGGTGFVGGHIVRMLLSRGHSVRMLARRRRDSRAQPIDRLEVVAGELRDAASLRRLTAGADAVIHLVGIIVPRGRNTFEAVHVEGTAAVVAAAREAGCARFVHMSALGARDQPGATPYHRTKRRGELVVQEGGIPTVVLRPAIINGSGNAPIHLLARLHRLLPMVPVFGDAQYAMQPVWVDDVALVFARAAETDTLSGTFELGGPDVMSYADFVRNIGRAIAHPRPLLHIPLTLARAASRLFDPLGYLAPITSAQLQMLVEGSATPHNAITRVFDVSPLGFEEGLRRFLP